MKGVIVYATFSDKIKLGIPGQYVTFMKLESGPRTSQK
jgi:hypothetical protein